MIYILAGNYAQAKDYARFKQYHPQEWRYIFDERDLQGVARGVMVIQVGTWHKRSDSAIIHEIMACRECEVLTDWDW